MEKSQQITMAILNTGVSAESIGLGVSTNTAKSFGFCFYAGQDKTKTKRFWLSRGGKVVSCRPALSIAEPLCTIMNEQSTYKEIRPKTELKDFVHSLWMHENNTGSSQKITIVPDSYFKMVITVKNNKVIAYFLTGLWTEEKIVSIASRATTFGCRLKILAAEYLLNQEIPLEKYQQLELRFLNVDKFDLSSFETVVEQWQNELIKRIPKKEIQGNKLRLSQLLDTMNGEISATEVSNQIHWTNRQINRYLNKYIGVSLKKYLNIQKCYHSYIQIREGTFFPEKGFFDQAHFIREIKKHTGETPKSLHKNQNDRFIQLKRISKK